MAMHPAVTEAHGGESIVTAPHLVQFRDAILDMCRSAPCAVFNATGAGILRGPGIVQATIDVALRAATRSALPPLPRLLQSSAAVDRLRAALQGDRLRGPSAGLASAWATVLAEHDPPDGRLADELDHALAQAAAWARSEAVAALP
jgi:hypothetical protein